MRNCLISYFGKKGVLRVKYALPLFSGHPYLTDKTLSPEGAVKYRGPTVHNGEFDMTPIYYIIFIACYTYRPEGEFDTSNRIITVGKDVTIINFEYQLRASEPRS
eukprot:sb/3478005/